MMSEIKNSIKLGSDEELYEIAFRLSSNVSRNGFKVLFELLYDIDKNVQKVAFLTLRICCNENSVPQIIYGIKHHNQKQDLAMLLSLLAFHDCSSYVIEVISLTFSDDTFVKNCAISILQNQSSYLTNEKFKKAKRLIETALKKNSIDQELCEYLLHYIKLSHINSANYCLWFSKANISRKEFIDFFSKMPKFHIEDNLALYENKATGVYFHFEFFQPDAKSLNEAVELPQIQMVLNYCKPHVFAIEASMILESVIDSFNFNIISKHLSGFENGVYFDFIKKKFIDTWLKGNICLIKNGICTKKQEENSNYLSLTTIDIEKFWNWNYLRKIGRNNIPRHVYILPILFITIDRKLFTAVMWRNGIPVLMPKVDYIIIMRGDLARINLKDIIHDECLLTFEAASPILKNFSINNEFEVKAYELFYIDQPIFVRDFILAAIPNSNYTRVNLEEIINAEFL